MRTPEQIADARKALARYDAACAEPDDDPGYFRRTDAAFDLVEPFRALIEPPTTTEGPALIAQRILDEYPEQNPGLLSPGFNLRAALEGAAGAGIQAAWGAQRKTHADQGQDARYWESDSFDDGLPTPFGGSRRGHRLRGAGIRDAHCGRPCAA